MSNQPFMPMFVGDFLAATIEWEGEERALYALLLMNQWSVGSLPADPKKLSKMIGYTQKNFDACWPTVSTKFIEQDGRLVNERLEAHRAKTVSLSEKNSNAGKKGAEARWQKNGERHQSANSKPIAIAIETPLAERQKKSNGVTDSNPSHPIPSHISPVDTSSHPEAYLLPENELKPRDENIKISPQGEMAIALRDRGVQVTSAHPTLLAWVTDGFTTQQAIDATALARMRKPHPEPIPAAYLDKILRQPPAQTQPEKARHKTKFEQVMEANGDV
jgi:uncharacterized protein YdaU (DUF1376 family)